MHACDSRGVTLSLGCAALRRLISFSPLAGGQGAVSRRVGSPAILTDELAESCDCQPALYLAVNSSQGMGEHFFFSLQGDQTETSHPHLPHYRAKRLLYYSDDIIVLLSQSGWHQSESLPDRKVCNCEIYFQQAAFSMISDIKDKKHEAGAEVEFKVMDERNVLIVCLCQLWPSGIPFLIQSFPTEASQAFEMTYFQATGLQLLLG